MRKIEPTPILAAAHLPAPPVLAASLADGKGKTNQESPEPGIDIRDSSHIGSPKTPDNVVPLFPKQETVPAAESGSPPAIREFTPAEWRRTLPSEIFQGVEPTSDFPQTGQERLLLALKTISQVDNPHYHGFITHFNGKPELIVELLKKFPPPYRPPKDYLYVQNFEQPDSPNLLIFKPGEGSAFQEKIESALERLLEKLPQVRTKPDFISRVVEIEESTVQEILRRKAEFEHELDSAGLGRIQLDDFDPKKLLGVDQGKLFGVNYYMEAPGEKKPRKQPGQEKQEELMTIPIEMAALLAGGVSDPVFVPRMSMNGTGYDIMSKADFQEKLVKPALGKKELLPQALTLSDLREKLTEFHAKWHEMEAANHETEYREEKKVKALFLQSAAKLIEKELLPVFKAYPTPYVAAYLEGMKDHLLKEEHLPLLMARDIELSELEVRNDGVKPLELKKQLLEKLTPNAFHLAELSRDLPFPIIYAKHPTPGKLFGTLIPNSLLKEESSVADQHHRIREGYMHQANRGWLVVNLLDAARAGSLDGIFNVVESGQIHIANPLALFSPHSYPEPVPFQGKVLFLDPEGFYDFLAYYDETLRSHFMKVPYNASPDAEEKPMRAFTANLLAEVKQEDLLPVAPSGLAALMEHLLRKADSKVRFAAHHEEAMNLLHEASALADKKGKKQVTGEHIEEAVRNQKFLEDLGETRLQEWIKKQVLKIETRGEKVGQGNGLVVFSLHDLHEDPPLPKGLDTVARALYGEKWLEQNQAKLAEAIHASQKRFGKDPLSFATFRGHEFGIPERVTATVSNTDSGASMRSNDARFIGPSMDKGNRNIESLLKEKLGEENFPLFYEIMTSWEQNHSKTDGDSGGLVTFTTIISKLSGIPMDQSVFITGAVGVHGDAQAIGGINEKFEGAFKTCLAQGLTGKQGVIFPASNAEDFMISKDVIAAADGKFHAWPVDEADQVVELALHVKADAAYAKAREKLREYRQKQL